MKYNCKYGLFHDRPCIDNQPSSNNGWIYTAMSKYALGIKYSKEDFLSLYMACENTTSLIYIIDRLPGKEHPPMSRDEVIGMASLDMPIVDLLERFDYKMYSDMIFTPFTLLDTIKALWSMRKKHRNYFWENEVLEAYPVAMRLFWHDRYYLKKISGRDTKSLEFFMFYLYAFSILLRGSAGEQNLLYLQLRDIGSYLYRFIPYRVNLLEYFGPSHIFNRQN